MRDLLPVLAFCVTLALVGWCAVRSGLPLDRHEEHEDVVVPRVDRNGLTPEALELWYQCVDVWQQCDYTTVHHYGDYDDMAPCAMKVADCEGLVSEANRRGT